METEGSLKRKLSDNSLSVGSWLTVGHEAVAEIMARAGFDWLTVDMEHSAITLPQAQQLVRVIELCGVVPFVRVGRNEPDIIKRVMDAGSHGVIVPMVNTPEDAARAVSAVKYPVQGTRGVGLARAQGYGMEFEKYKDWVNKESIVIAQIEHIKAIENLEEILGVEGIDGTIIGPYDLSGSLGHPGKFDLPEVKEALAIYVSTCKKLGKPMGTHVIPPELSDVREKLNEGYRFVAWSLDTLFLGVNCRSGMEELRKSIEDYA